MSRIVTADDLDDLDHVNNVRYVQWIQDISKSHWEQKAPKKMKDNAIWVVKQHHIEYLNSATLGDEVVVRTYIKQAERAISTRVVEMFLKEADKPLLRSETQWCLLNSKTLKPMRISDEIKLVFKQESGS